MRKYVFLLTLSVVVIAGCTNKKIDITDTNLDVASCDKYFEIMECVFEKDNDEDYTEEKRDELRQIVKDKQVEWKGLDSETLDKKCLKELEKFATIEDRLVEIGCSSK